MYPNRICTFQFFLYSFHHTSPILTWKEQPPAATRYQTQMITIDSSRCLGSAIQLIVWSKFSHFPLILSIHNARSLSNSHTRVDTKEFWNVKSESFADIMRQLSDNKIVTQYECIWIFKNQRKFCWLGVLDRLKFRSWHIVATCNISVIITSHFISEAEDHFHSHPTVALFKLSLCTQLYLNSSTAQTFRIVVAHCLFTFRSCIQEHNKISKSEIIQFIK